MSFSLGGQPLHDGMVTVAVPTAGRFAPGVSGVIVVVREQFRRFRFVVTAGQAGKPRHITFAVRNAIETAFDGRTADATIEEADVLLPSGALPIPGNGQSVSELVAMLRPFVRHDEHVADARPKAVPAA